MRDSYRNAGASVGCLVGISTSRLSFLFLRILPLLRLWLLSSASESVSVVSPDVVRSMVCSQGCFLSRETLRPPRSSRLSSESPAAFCLCLDASGPLLLGLWGAPPPPLAGESACPLSSEELESVRRGEEAELRTGLAPGGRDSEDRMQSSIGNNLGSTDKYQVQTRLRDIKTHLSPHELLKAPPDLSL